MTRVDIEHEIAQLKPRAHAEHLLSLAAPERTNPWAGSTKRLASLEKELQSLAERSAATDFLALVERYEESLRRSQDPEVRTRLRQVETELAQADRALLNRWDTEHLVHSGVRAAKSTTLRVVMENPEAEIPKLGLGYTDAQIRDIARWKRLTDEQLHIASGLDGYSQMCREMVAEHPELADIAHA